jgi:hypothetical protein
MELNLRRGPAPCAALEILLPFRERVAGYFFPSGNPPFGRSVPRTGGSARQSTIRHLYDVRKESGGPRPRAGSRDGHRLETTWERQKG